MGRKLLNIGIVKERIKTINPNIEILDDYYINSKTKLKCRCLIDGYEFYMSWNKLQKGQGCSVCKRCKKYTLKEVKDMLLKTNPNIEIIDGKYENNTSDLLVKCSDGHIWNTNWANLSQGIGCKVCNRGGMYTIEKINQMLSIINPNIIILDDKYYGSRSYMKCHCKICNKEFKAMWTTLQQGGICTHCAKNKRRSFQNPCWKGGVSDLNKYSRRFIKKWKHDSLVKAGFKCEMTGVKEDIVVHHIYSFNEILLETFEITGLEIKSPYNYSDDELHILSETLLDLHYKYGLGVCISSDIHNEFHKIYGKGNNTPSQWSEFIKKYKEREVIQCLN